MNNIIRDIAMIIALPVALLAQEENWVYRYHGGFEDDGANAVVYGADGNVYAAGFKTDTDFSSDFTVISLTTAGDTNWVYRYNELMASGDEARAIVWGPDSNIYVAGTGSYGSSYFDFTVISLTTDGDTNWVYRYNGPGDGWDGANAIVYGDDGNIYAAGCSYGSGTNNDFTVISLTTDGDTNWVYRYDGQSNLDDEAYSVVYGDDGNIYAAGYGVSAGGFIVISLTTAGDTNWIYRRNESGSDKAYSLVYGDDGNIYAAGTSNPSGGLGDLMVISLATTGDTNWICKYNGPGNSGDNANAVVYGADGNIYAAGYSAGDGTDDDFTVISLTTAGDTNWVYRYNGPGGLRDFANYLAYGGDGNIYAAGTSDYVAGVSGDFIVISLTTAGDTNWVYRYSGPGNGDDWAKSICYGDDNNIYAAGNSYGSGTYDDFTVISLDPDFGVEEKNTVVREYDYGATIFNGPLRLPPGKKCKVFDITGSIVTPETIKPGVYFVEIDNRAIRKVIKVK